MRWEPVAAPDLKQDLILFDGDCVLCSHWARFVHKRDPGHRFKFVALQSPYGRELASRFGVDPTQPQTNLVVVEGRALFKSDAAIAALAALQGWSWVAAARVIPRALRNWFYDRIARNRYRLFGRRERCWVDDPTLRDRIITTAERAPSDVHSETSAS